VGFGLSVICVQKVPLRKVFEITVLREGLSTNVLSFQQIQLFADQPGSVRKTLEN